MTRAGSVGRLELVRLVVERGLAERFVPSDLFPTAPGRVLAALTSLVEDGHVERVIGGVCRWHYRLTASALAAHAEGREPAPVRDYSCAGIPRDYTPTSVGYPCNRRKDKRRRVSPPK